jgi:hypothetical protein
MSKFYDELQEILGKHQPNEVEELNLDCFTEKVESFKLYHKEGLELYNGGTINGATISGGTVTSGNHTVGGIDLISGELRGYCQNAYVGKINMVNGGIRIGDSGSIFDAYIDLLYNNLINIGANKLTINGAEGQSGSFVSADGKTVTVTKGIITGIS